MAVTASVQEFLRKANVAYSVFPHRPAYTAQEEAAVTHVPGRDWAKAVISFADDEPIQTLAHEEQIVFNAGTRRDAVSMRYEDFAALTYPVVGRFAQRRPSGGSQCLTA